MRSLWFSVSPLCFSVKQNYYTELHREDTERHRECIPEYKYEQKNHFSQKH